MARRGERGAAGGRFATLGLVILAVGTAVLIYLAFNRESDPPGSNGGAAEDASSSETEAPDAEPSDSPPNVVDQVRADFTASDALPAGGRTYDNPAAGGPLQVSGGALTHAAPKGPLAIGTLEVQLPSAVKKIGAMVDFPPGDVGSVGLVGWTTSFVDARAQDQPVPTSGLRLVASANDWELTVYDKGEFVIGGDDFEEVKGPQTFEVYRSDSTLWVVDPAGTVTMVTDPLVGELAGPWASWQVIEDTPNETPVRIREIWAG